MRDIAISSSCIGVFIPPVPSAPPDSVSISEVTSSSITVQWEMVPCIHHNGDITGYSVQYTGGGSTQTVSVSGESTTEATITELTASTSFSVGVAAVNDAGTGPYSSAMDQLTAGITLLLDCSLMNHHMYLLLLTVVAPVLSSGDTTATSISLSWTSGGSEGVSYEVMWQRDTSLGCPDDDMISDTVSDGFIEYDIMGLQEDSSYSVTVMATNAVGSQISDPITATTLVAGKAHKHRLFHDCIFSQLHLLLPLL